MKKKNYKYEDIYIRWDVGYSEKDDRTCFNYITVVAKTIDNALEKAKRKLKKLKLNNPIVMDMQFSEVVNSKNKELLYEEDDKMWHPIDLEEESNKDKKEDLKPLDKTCWYINPFDVNKRAFNQKGEIVDLNSEQSQSDYKYFKDLHLTPDNTKNVNGRIVYTTVCPYLYECIVYGHNHRYGYIKDNTNSLTEAINCVRVHYTIISK
jgi:hypothetical protein